MSTVGKVCLVITTLLLLIAFLPIPSPYGGWSPKLLVIHNQWSEQFRDSREKTKSAITSNELARQELYKATADIEGLNIGWDEFWTVPARGPNNPPNAPQLAVLPDGRLQLNNLGVDQGLKTREFTDENGATRQMSPTLHAFVGVAEGFVYAGEYTAVAINSSSATLRPVHARDQARLNAVRQNVNNVWRLRTLIPPSLRMTNDDLNQRLRNISELTQRTDANIERQQRLKQEAEVAYNTRRGELLGDANRDAVFERPEFTEGLLKVIEDIEEERNQLQLNVDERRRKIREAIQKRQDLLDRLNSKASTLPGLSLALETTGGTGN